MQSPLKAALTGLELVLARAQIWEESAAKHVSLAEELESIAALATRWRKLELASWRDLLHTTRRRHAEGKAPDLTCRASLATAKLRVRELLSECSHFG